ncbi:MAG: lysylphosphatidylglycerol synthase transmembrane domain-containing protein [Planctomycetota bacterium]
MRRGLAMVLGFACAGLFAWLAFRKLDWQATWLALRGADWRLLALAPPVMLSSILFRAFRWRLILADQPGARVGPLMLAAGIGVGANALLPAKLGEAVGAQALGRLADLSRVQSLGILVLTRVVDLFVLFTLVLVATIILPGAALRPVRGAGLVIAALSALILLLPLIGRAAWGATLLRRAAALLRRVLGEGPLDLAEKFARGLASASRVGHLLAFVASTLLLWVVLSVSLLIALRAFNLHVSAMLVPFIMAMIAASAMLPSAPGNVGTFHFFGITALGLAGVAAEPAAACIIIYHALDMLGALVLGVVCTTLAGRWVFVLRSPRPPAFEPECPRAVAPTSEVS